jgi:hypothetical protein
MKPKRQHVKGCWNWIKTLFNPEYELIPVNSWNSEKGQSMKILMRSYHQLNAEEELRVHKEMEKNTKKR